MGLGTGATAAIIGGTSALGGIASSVIGANAAGNAATQEVNADKNAEQIVQQNDAPYLAAGNQSLSQLMAGLASGKFGTPSTFTAPTLAQAEATPGYQFSQTQGDQGILEGAAAAGGAISGGTLKSLDNYNDQLAQTNYGNIFNQALSGYQANLAGQNQAYQQLLTPAELGASVTNNENSSLSQLLQSMGQSQAAGTVGTANAITNGISGATNSITGALTLSQLGQILSNGGGLSVPQATPAGSSTFGLTSPAVSSSSGGGIPGVYTPGISGSTGLMPLPTTGDTPVQIGQLPG